MGIEPTKIGYFLARVELPICGDVSSQKSSSQHLPPFFFFLRILLRWMRFEGLQ